MFEILTRIMNVKELRTRLLATLGILVIFRFGTFIPLPGVDVTQIRTFLDGAASEEGALGKVLKMADLFTGGALSNGSIFSLGIMPYISASIIMQILVAIIPSLSKLQHEGTIGRKKINQYTRLGTVFLCIVQSMMICSQVISTNESGAIKILALDNLGVWFISGKMMFIFYGMASLTVGALFLMWLGEQIDEFGIGNGISLLIMGGIVARLPVTIQNLATGVNTESGLTPAGLIALTALGVLMTFAVVLITLGTRRIPIQQSKATRGRRVYGGQRQFLPLRVNQAGVIPIIFAQSLLMVPVFLFGWLAEKTNWMWLSMLVQPGSFWYTVLYVVLIMFFCYFYTAITFNPNEMADNLKQSGMFLPGIRPGKSTAEHLEKVMTRIALAGSIFLSFIALVPQMLTTFLPQVDYNVTTMLGGTSILIVVGVALDVMQRIESYLVMRNYEGFGLAGGRLKSRRG